jgi:hypothetical protein
MIFRYAIIPLVLMVSALCGVITAQCNAPAPPPAPGGNPPEITRAPTMTPTQTETVSPTATNLPLTETPTPTLTATLQPTDTPTPTETQMPTIPAGRPKVIPTTGAPSQHDGLFALLIVGAALVVIGGYLLAREDNPTW